MEANNNITARNGNIVANAGYIEALTGYIRANSYLEAGSYVEAQTYIEAQNDITSVSGDIKADGGSPNGNVRANNEVTGKLLKADDKVEGPTVHGTRVKFA